MRGQIQNVTDARIIIRETANKYRFIEGDHVQYMECDSGTSELTEWFVVGLMQKVADGSNILQALQHAVKFEQTRLAGR